MPSTLPDGEPAPIDGALPASATRRLGERGFGVYVHVPFCASRCGYCDFNTYTPAELGGGARRCTGTPTRCWPRSPWPRRVLGGRRARAVDTVFFGGGTPTMLPPDDLGRILAGLDEAFGLAADAEVTTEANPESVDPGLAEGAAPRRLHPDLARHAVGRAARARAAGPPAHPGPGGRRRPHEARAAGFDHVNLDLIYGTPGETADDFAASLSAAVAAGVDHVSAYSLIVEDGTRLAARVRRGEVARARRRRGRRPLPGWPTRCCPRPACHWYEVSNWARPGGECRHNLLYWRGGDWWGFGPGAHSHVGGVRWWNVKHPSAYARRLVDGRSPAQARELLSPADRHTEDVMLRPAPGRRPAGVVPATDG